MKKPTRVYPGLEALTIVLDDGGIGYKLTLGNAIITNPESFEVRAISDGIAELRLVVLVSWPGMKRGDG